MTQLISSIVIIVRIYDRNLCCPILLDSSQISQKLNPIDKNVSDKVVWFKGGHKMASLI